MKKMHRVLLAAVGLGMGACASFYDSGWQSLEASAFTNPSSEAIVGLWHRKEATAFGSNWTTLMFNSDGTGYVDYLLSDVVRDERLDQCDWKYLGNGLWVVTGVAKLDGPVEFRMSGEKLLMHHKGSSYTLGWVFERAE